MLGEREDKRPPLTIIIGGHGFVGSAVAHLLKGSGFQISTPSKIQLDITSFNSIKRFFLRKMPLIIVNFASYTDIQEAEKQRADKKASAWRLNVGGTKKISSACKKFNVFLIHISTDGVFTGFKEDKGPYWETSTPIDNSKNLSWYGYTKLKGEKEVIKSKTKFAIIRISYPFGNPNSEKDFLIKTIKYIKSGTPFYIDQFFTPTFIPDLAEAIEKISLLKKVGIYHVVCNKITTPYKFALYTARKMKLKDTINKMQIEEYLKNPRSIKRSQYATLSNKKTQKILHQRFHDWREAIDGLYY